MWEKFDNDVDNVLVSRLAGGVETKLKVKSTIVSRMGLHQFGEVEKHNGESMLERIAARSVKATQGIQKDLRQHTKQYRHTGNSEKAARP